MTRAYYLAVTIGLALAPMAQASAQPAAAGGPDPEAKMQQTALNACNADLDRGHFDYTTIDECVSAKMDKMKRESRASAAGAPTRQPN